MRHLIQIGNSQGVRIPKSMIIQAGLEKAELVFTVVPSGLLISPVHVSRQGWAMACEAMHAEAADRLLLNDMDNKFDKDEWEW